MEQGQLFTWLVNHPQGQFLAGVVVLVFGSKAVLSERFWEGRFGAFGMLSRWFKERQDKSARQETKEIAELRCTVAQQHDFIVYISSELRRIEVKAATDGWELPTPKTMNYIAFLERRGRRGRKEKSKREEDDDSDEAVGDRPNLDRG